MGCTGDICDHHRDSMKPVSPAEVWFGLRDDRLALGYVLVEIRRCNTGWENYVNRMGG